MRSPEGPPRLRLRLRRAAWADAPDFVFCGPHGSVCSPVTQHMRALLERNSKKKPKLRKKPKPYVEEPDGRASPAAWVQSAQLCSPAWAAWPLSLTASGLEGVSVGWH